MTDHRTDIAIIGGGLAAHAAAATLADSDADVLMVYPPSPGASALWGGLGQAYGPSHPLFEPSIGEFGALSAPERAIVTSRRDRFERLLGRRAHHPYRRLGLDADDVATQLKGAVDALGYAGWDIVDDERVVPSAHSAPFVPDLAARSVALSAVLRGESVGVARCPAVANWRCDRLIEALDAAGAVEARPVDLPALVNLEGLAEHPVKIAAQLDEVMDDGGGPLVDQAGEAAESLGLDLLILPPCLGGTAAEHRAWFDALVESVPCRVAEAAASRWSIHGWRLDRYLRSRSASRIVSGRTESIAADGAAPARVRTSDGVLEADGVILATGRWIGGGLRRRAPLREPLLGLDLWVDGAPLQDPDEVWPPDLTADRPWRDHRLLRLGVAVDETLCPLAYGGRPAHENVFCAGRIIGGTNPFVDGTTEGVDLVTGRLAARAALEHLEAPDREVTR